MSISNPNHWKEPFFDKGDKYDKIVEIISLLNDIEGVLVPSTHVARFSANRAFRYFAAHSTSHISSTGAIANTTGSANIYFVFEIPDWLSRAAAAFSKTVTATTITVNWDDTVAADYIDNMLISYLPYNAGGSTIKYNSSTDRGNGTTGFENSVADMTDTVMVAGDSLYMVITLQQGTAGSCKIKSFDVTFTVA